MVLILFQKHTVVSHLQHNPSRQSDQDSIASIAAMDVDEMDIDIDLGVADPSEYELGTVLVVRSFPHRSISRLDIFLLLLGSEDDRSRTNCK